MNSLGKHPSCNPLNLLLSSQGSRNRRLEFWALPASVLLRPIGILSVCANASSSGSQRTCWLLPPRSRALSLPRETYAATTNLRSFGHLTVHRLLLLLLLLGCVLGQICRPPRHTGLRMQVHSVLTCTATARVTHLTLSRGSSPRLRVLSAMLRLASAVASIEAVRSTTTGLPEATCHKRTFCVCS